MNPFLWILKLVLLPFILVLAFLFSIGQSIAHLFYVITRNKAKKNGKRVVFTGGRSPATLELCRLFHARGHKVIVIETQRMYICRFSRSVSKNYRVIAPTVSYEQFIQQVGDVLVKQKADLLVGTCEEIFYLAKGKATLQAMAPNCRLFFEDIETLRSLHDKYAFSQLVGHYRETEQLEIPSPHTVLISNEEELRQAVGRGKVVLKPCYSRFGQSTVILPKGMEHKKVKRVLARVKEGTKYISQEYLDGTQVCTYSVVNGGVVLAHCNYGTEFTPGGRQGASLVFESQEWPDIDQWVISLMGAMRLTGHYAFDFMYTKDSKLYAIECNPRATSGIHLFTKQPEIADCFFQEAPEFQIPLRPPEDQLPDTIIPALLCLNYLRRTGPNSFNQLGRWMQVFLTGRDVVWDITDPMPLVNEFLGESYVMVKGMFLGMNSIEATSADIEWNGQ